VGKRIIRSNISLDLLRNIIIYQILIFVTGGSGFVGSHLLYELSKRNVPIIAFKRITTKLTEFEQITTHRLKVDGGDKSQLSNIQWIDVDLSDYYDLSKHLQKGDVFIHCAGLVSFQPKDKNNLIYNNVQVTKNIVNVCIDKEISKLVYLSSVASLNRIPDLLINEDNISDLPAFNSYYSLSKYQAEMEIWRGGAEGLPITTLNPGIILGVGDVNKGSNKIIGTLLKGLSFYPMGSNGFVDVEDVAKQLIILMDSDTSLGKRYISVGINSTYKNLFDVMADSFNAQKPSIAVYKWMTTFAWIVSLLMSKITNSNPIVTKETAASSQNNISFNNTKFRTDFSTFSYTSLPDICKKVSQFISKKPITT
jgi:nucleoside-diphosphate-sugar epimerase